MPSTATRTGILIAAEGLDGSGKTLTLELLARWIERKGAAVQVIPWEPSLLVRRASRDLRTRHLLTPRVAALLSAADAVQVATERIQPALRSGEVVLADRYAWTAVAREIARGLDPTWVAGLYRLLPCPDLVFLLRPNRHEAVERALASRPSSIRDDAIAAAFGDFLDRLVRGFDRLAAGSASGEGPWPVRTVVLEGKRSPESLLAEIRDAVRPLLRAREDAA